MKYLLAFIICFKIFEMGAQESYDATGLSFNLNSSININSKYSLKPAVKGRYVSLINKTDGLERIEEKSQRIDLQMALEKRLKSTTKIAVGALHRFSDAQNATRFFEQLGWVKNTNSNITFIHRINSDQTFRGIDDIEIRLRYRFGISLPLEGYNLNSNEKYFLAYTEILGKHRNPDFTNEVRLKLVIGKLMKGGSKAELGIDIRYDNPFDGIRERLYLLDLAYYFNLN
ncbi:MAG: DUF2490 domain-containing protein [Vicingaceae bacterium]